ncbi:MAG: diacylglycerol kinase family protein [Chloroflexota bacterium]
MLVADKSRFDLQRTSRTARTSERPGVYIGSRLAPSPRAGWTRKDRLRASIVYNPTARRAPLLTRVREACLRLQPEWDIAVQVSEGAGHATVLAREAATGGADVIFACGGDGTVNEVANGLVGTGSTLAVIRGGTSNVFAVEIGVPRSPERALAALVSGTVRRFDLGVAAGRHFLLMAGVGFDAHSIRGVSERVKRSLGVGAYYLSAAVQLARYRSQRVKLSIDGDEQEVDVYWLVLGNTRSYAGIFDVTPGAMANDGYLDLCLLTGRPLPWTIASLAAFTLRRHNWAGAATFQRVHELEIKTPGIAVQVDGEYLAETPMLFTVKPQAMPVLVPRGRALPMLQDEGE